MVQTQQPTLERIALVSPVERISYAMPLRGQPAREAYEGARELAKQYYKNSPALEQHFSFDEETGEIRGSNAQWMILLNQYLATKDQRTLTFDEARQLPKGTLSNGAHRDFGIVLYSEAEPNLRTAQLLAKGVKAHGWQFPIVAHYTSLKLTKNGFNIEFADDLSLVKTGNQAQAIINACHYKESSGVCRLDREDEGHWDANGDLADSWDDGLVDFVCAQGTRANFEADTLKKIDAAYASEQQRFLTDLDQRKARALEILRGKK